MHQMRTKRRQYILTDMNSVGESLTTQSFRMLTSNPDSYLVHEALCLKTSIFGHYLLMMWEKGLPDQH